MIDGSKDRHLKASASWKNCHASASQHLHIEASVDGKHPVSSIAHSPSSIARDDRAQTILCSSQPEHRRCSSELLVGGKCSPRVSPEVSPQSHGGNTERGYASGRKRRLSAADVEKQFWAAFTNAIKLRSCHVKGIQVPSHSALSSIETIALCWSLQASKLGPPLQCLPQ